jgi:hypothetical protein
LPVIAQAAFAVKPAPKRKLAEVLEQKPLLRAEGIVRLREANRFCLSGSNDESHYFAVTEFLRTWRAVEFQRAIGDIDITYSPLFEIRSFWVSWRGEAARVVDFQLRNMATDRTDVPFADML